MPKKRRKVPGKFDRYHENPTVYKCEDCGMFATIDQVEAREEFLGGFRHRYGFGCQPTKPIIRKASQPVPSYSRKNRKYVYRYIRKPNASRLKLAGVEDVTGWTEPEIESLIKAITSRMDGSTVEVKVFDAGVKYENTR